MNVSPNFKTFDAWAVVEARIRVLQDYVDTQTIGDSALPMIERAAIELLVALENVRKA